MLWMTTPAGRGGRWRGGGGGAKYDGFARFLGKPSLMIMEPGQVRRPGFTVMSPPAAGLSGGSLIHSEPGFASAQRT